MGKSTLDINCGGFGHEVNGSERPNQSRYYSRLVVVPPDGMAIYDKCDVCGLPVVSSFQEPEMDRLTQWTRWRIDTFRIKEQPTLEDNDASVHVASTDHLSQ